MIWFRHGPDQNGRISLKFGHFARPLIIRDWEQRFIWAYSDVQEVHVQFLYRSFRSATEAACLQVQPMILVGTNTALGVSFYTKFIRTLDWSFKVWCIASSKPIAWPVSRNQSFWGSSCRFLHGTKSSIHIWILLPLSWIPSAWFRSTANSPILCQSGTSTTSYNMWRRVSHDKL